PIPEPEASTLFCHSAHEYSGYRTGNRSIPHEHGLVYRAITRVPPNLAPTGSGSRRRPARSVGRVRGNRDPVHFTAIAGRDWALVFGVRMGHCEGPLARQRRSHFSVFNGLLGFLQLERGIQIAEQTWRKSCGLEIVSGYFLRFCFAEKKINSAANFTQRFFRD